MKSLLPDSWSAKHINLQPHENLWLRRLRFPAGLEEEFRVQYAKASVNSIRFGLLVLAVIQLVVSIPMLAAIVSHQQPLAGIYPTLWVAAFTLALLGITYWSGHLKFQQFLVALWPAIVLPGCLRVLMGGPFGHGAPTDYEALSLPGFLVTTVVAAYGILRLRLSLASIICWSTVAAYIYLAIQNHHLRAGAVSAGKLTQAVFLRQSEDLKQNVVNLLVINLLGMVVAYQVERGSRRDFLFERSLAAEREKSESLLLNILPETIADRLKSGESIIADRTDDVTVLFADIVGFTPMAAEMEAEDVVKLLNKVFTGFDGLAAKYGLEKIKTIGDAYMVAGGLPNWNRDHATAIVSMAKEMIDLIDQMNREFGTNIAIRIGINSGPVVAGVIGESKFSYDLWGDTVNIAQRIESSSEAGRIQVSEGIRAQLESDFQFGPLRRVEVKGVGTISVAWLE